MYTPNDTIQPEALDQFLIALHGLFFVLKKKPKQTVLINKAINCFKHFHIVLLKTSFIKRREKIQSVLYVNEPFSGNVKMVIATSNDEINYRNLFVVPSANEP